MTLPLLPPRCPHCDREIRFFETFVRDTARNIWHTACMSEANAERNSVADARRLEDWQLESRRHETAGDFFADAYYYHMTKGAAR